MEEDEAGIKIRLIQGVLVDIGFYVPWHNDDAEKWALISIILNAQPRLRCSNIVKSRLFSSDAVFNTHTSILHVPVFKRTRTFQTLRVDKKILRDVRSFTVTRKPTTENDGTGWAASRSVPFSCRQWPTLSGAENPLKQTETAHHATKCCAGLKPSKENISQQDRSVSLGYLK